MKKLIVLTSFIVLLISSCSDAGSEDPRPVITYTITYDGNGATQGEVPEPGSIGAENDNYTIAANSGNLALQNNRFTGWNTSPDGSGTSYSMGQEVTNSHVVEIYEDIILYAQWELLPLFTVNYIGNGSTMGTPPEDQEKFQGDSLTITGQNELQKRGFNFAGWNTQADGNGTTYQEGDLFSQDANLTLYAIWAVIEDYISFEGEDFVLSFVNGGYTFPRGIDDNGTFSPGSSFDATASVLDSYWISQNEVSYQLWKKVVTWATSGINGSGAGEYTIPTNCSRGAYSTNNTTRGYGEGYDDHPVTAVTWREALVWCNALTEWYNAYSGENLEPVYYSDSSYTQVLRVSGNSSTIESNTPGSYDNPYIKADAKGFRLLTNDEWELAARFIGDFNNDGDLLDNGEFYNGNSASGSLEPVQFPTASGSVAWYSENSESSTHPCGEKTPNVLELYDMSGNVAEFCFDWSPSMTGYRSVRGGSWDYSADYLAVGSIRLAVRPYSAPFSTGVRFGRTE